MSLKKLRNLQHGIDILYEYCKRWRLEVNIQKTIIVVFRKGGRLSHDDHWFYSDQRLCTAYTFPEYCKRWRLEVNIQKTIIVVFRKGGRLSHDDHWFYSDQRLCTAYTFLYLGVLFSSTGKWSQAQSTLAHQALKAEFSLQTNYSNSNVRL